MIIGIYGGSFDPIHCGHLTVARNVLHSGAVDEVCLVVSRINPLKRGVREPASFDDRYAMALLAVDNEPGISVCDIERTLPEPSYTIDTLSELKRLHPEHQYRLIIGSDNIASFSKWKAYDRLLSEFGVIVHPRPGSGTEPLLEGMTMLQGVPESSASSTSIRSGLQLDLPKQVAKYIYDNHLYSTSQ